MGRRKQTATVIRVVKSTGIPTRLRLELRPLPDQRVTIVKAYRKRQGEERYRRVREHELVNVAFKQLRLRRNWDDVFAGVHQPQS